MFKSNKYTFYNININVLKVDQILSLIYIKYFDFLNIFYRKLKV